ncbi:MAG TPA: acetate--CoA ligase family protein [Candidatus Acidoferrum sp.]|nr:acetate--CoA ligase family protein [Candidatus Acidoferrum sp.]
MTVLGSLLVPRSIALIGATEASSWAQAVIANLTGLGYEGALHLVHPRHAEQFGRPCHPTLNDIPGEVDCAYVMTGTDAAPQVIEDCGRKGVPNVVMLSAGFKEVGEKGLEREQKMVARCQELGITLLGPNCLGFINYKDRIAAYGLLLTASVPEGAIALISQSGVMLLHFHRLAAARGIGLAAAVSIGNEAMLKASDLVRDFVRREDVRVVGALLEGFRDPAGFLAAAEAAFEAQKPLVVLKVGRSEASRRAVIAHTGSLAGADAVVDAVLRQKGAIRVTSPEELIETCALLATSGWPRGGRTAVVTTSGGACGLVSDLASGTRVEIPDFAAETKTRLADLLPTFGTPQNPLDTTGVIVNQPGLLAACVDVVMADGRFDALLINSDPPRDAGASPGRVEERLAPLAEVVRRAPIFTALSATVSGELTPFGREALARHGLHFANGLQLGIRALDNAVFYGRKRSRSIPPVSTRVRRIETPDHGWTGVITEVDAKRLLASHQIGVPDERLVQSAADAVAAAAAIGYPVVLKVQSRDVAHKTEVGGVRLGLRTAAEVRRAYAQVKDAARGVRFEGVLVSQQVEPVAELIAGISSDAQFGNLVLVGMGGIFTESMRDVSLRMPPIDEQTALEMLEELRGAAVLDGVRGRPPADRAALVKVLVALGDIALDLGGRLVELDINPLFALPVGALAGDALLVMT